MSGGDLAGEAVAAADGVDQVQRVAVDVAEHEVGPLLLEQLKRGGLVVGDEHAVAVGEQVVGEEAGGRRVLLGEQDRAGGSHEGSFH